MTFNLSPYPRHKCSYFQPPQLNAYTYCHSLNNRFCFSIFHILKTRPLPGVALCNPWVSVNCWVSVALPESVWMFLSQCDLLSQCDSPWVNVTLPESVWLSLSRCECSWVSVTCWVSVTLPESVWLFLVIILMCRWKIPTSYGNFFIAIKRT